MVTADICSGEGQLGAWQCQGFFRASLRQYIMREATSPSPSTEQKSWSHLVWVVEVRESMSVKMSHRHW